MSNRRRSRVRYFPNRNHQSTRKMILSKELIVAVRATVKLLNDKYQHSQAKKRELEESAIQAFFRANPVAAKKRRQLEKSRAKLKAAEERLEAYMTSLGLSYNFSYISDSKKFHKAGGRVPFDLKKPRHVEMTLAMLAGASEREGKLMLKQLGINWS